MDNKSFMVFFLKQKILITIAILIPSIALSYLLVKYGLIVFISGIGVLVLIIILVYEFQGKLSLNKSLILIPLIVCSLPLQRIFLTTFPMQVAAQLLIIPIILFYIVKLPAHLRQAYFQKAKPLVFLTSAFIFSLFSAYLISGKLKNVDWTFLLSLFGSVSYAYLACIYCNDMKSIQKIMWVLIVIGIIQLPVMYAMGRGWTEHLPGVLSRLSNGSWGGFASGNGSTTLRYPGMFGDYELLAEYLDITVLFSIGMSIFASSSRERTFSILSSFLLIVAGFYTGTRTFVIGIGVGLGMMVILFLINPGFWKKLKNILAIGIILVLALYLLSSQEIFRGYIDRFLTTNFSSGYYDSRNIVWKVGLSMMEKLPFAGFGTQTMEIFNRIAGGFYIAPHSLYLSMALKAGFPGIIALLILICTPFLWMAQILLDRKMSPYHAWAIVFLSVWFFWIINEIKIEFIRYAFYMNIVFFLLGIFASYYQIANKKALA